MMALLDKHTSERGPTVRQVLHQHWLTRLASMTDNGKPVWTKVYATDLDEIDNVACPAVGIDYGDEEREPTLGGCATYHLPVIFQFRFAAQNGVDEQAAFQYYLGLMQFAILNDPAMRKIAQSISEVGNTHSIIGVGGVYPGGSLVTRVTYKTRLNNPYDQV